MRCFPKITPLLGKYKTGVVFNFTPIPISRRCMSFKNFTSKYKLFSSELVDVKFSSAKIFFSCIRLQLDDEVVVCVAGCACKIIENYTQIKTQ